MTYDLIIRSGTIVDGLGGQPYVGDVAVQDSPAESVGEVGSYSVARRLPAYPSGRGLHSGSRIDIRGSLLRQPNLEDLCSAPALHDLKSDSSSAGFEIVAPQPRGRPRVGFAPVSSGRATRPRFDLPG